MKAISKFPEVFVLAVFVLGVLVSSANAEFLVPNREYRCPPGDQACTSPHHLSSFEKYLTSKGNPFSIDFVEDNDKGQPRLSPT